VVDSKSFFIKSLLAESAVDIFNENAFITKAISSIWRGTDYSRNIVLAQEHMTKISSYFND